MAERQLIDALVQFAALMILKRKIPNSYNKFLIELGPRHQIADFRNSFSDHEALKRIKALREGYDWTTYIEISMLIPVCASCKISADVQFGEQNLPEVFITNWQDQYKNLGIDKDLLCEMEREIRVHGWEGLFCFKCLNKILFKESNEKFYIFFDTFDRLLWLPNKPWKKFCRLDENPSF